MELRPYLDVIKQLNHGFCHWFVTKLNFILSLASDVGHLLVKSKMDSREPYMAKSSVWYTLHIEEREGEREKKKNGLILTILTIEIKQT